MFIEYPFSILAAGFAGGLLRGLVGFIKYKNASKKSVPFHGLYYLATVLVSGMVGLLAAWVSADLKITFLNGLVITPAIASVIGYAGGDFL